MAKKVAKKEVKKPAKKVVKETPKDVVPALQVDTGRTNSQGEKLYLDN